MFDFDAGIFALVAQATLVVKLVLALLVLMSLASWTIIIMKLVYLSNTRKKAAEDLDAFQSARDLRGAVQVLGRTPQAPAYQVAMRGVHELTRLEDSGLPEASAKVVQDSVRRALEQGVNVQLDKMGSYISFLATCANAAPFIGLFGTVWGIMHSFHAIGQMKTAALAAVAPGISEALVATAVGLAVAIPATIAYNAFRGLLGRAEMDLMNLSGAFQSRVQRELPLRLAEQRDGQGRR
jgi:biopolymer transport protein TolQ